MIDKKTFSELALALPSTERVVHFERDGFKVIGRRMFASYLEKDNTANIFLSPIEQKMFCKFDKKHIYPVPNKWGEKGVTTFVLNHLEADVVREALLSAYSDVVKSAPKKSRSKSSK